MAKVEVATTLETLEALKKIASLIENEGSALTAVKIKRTLGIDDKTFTSAVNYGCHHKFLKWGSHNYYSLLKQFLIPEEAYYDAIKLSIEALWHQEGYEKNQFYVENTSRRDSKIEGPWTRPDLTLVSLKKFPWTVGTEFDVVTFEIKRPENANVLAVFEALSHVAAATRAYVVFPIDVTTWRNANPAQERRVRDECIRHGVGLILVESLAANSVATHVLRAARREIDHEKCSDFLDAVVSHTGKRKISEWKS